MSLETLNPCELEIDLFCKGLRIDPSCTLEEDARLFARTRAGLGSGLELVLPGRGVMKDVWVNAPVEEDFAQVSPYLLVKRGGEYAIIDERGPSYAVRIPHEPRWYTAKTSRGHDMCRIGVLQGTYLGIYIDNSCGFWYYPEPLNCQFCTTGANVGVNEVAEKDKDEVAEVCQAAKDESNITFVHFNAGFHPDDTDLEKAAPYVKTVKEKVGLLTGVQVSPTSNLWKYDWLIDLGTDHFSFCYEFHNPEYFAKYLPGKEKLIGQKKFFKAMEYTAKKLGKGAVSGEIITGVEPVEDTLKAIDYITEVGAFPTVCIFRPTVGADMESVPPPSYEDMQAVMKYMFEACRRNNIPIGMAPNIEVSIIVNPEDAAYLADRAPGYYWYRTKLAAMRFGAKLYFAPQLRPHEVKADSRDPEPYRALAAT
jgi:hypothetical protein